MIRFTCPTCRKALKSPDHGTGRKTHCPRCGQRLMVPPPPQMQDKTLVGQPRPESSNALSAPPADRLQDVRAAEEKPSTLSASNPFDFVELEQVGGSSDAPKLRKMKRKHSGLGMASFIIAVLVGGLDVILGVFVVVNIAHSGQDRRVLQDRPVYRDSVEGELIAKMKAGGMAMICLNCMSIPLCLVGVGMAFVGLIAHRGRNHLFTWLGLFANGVVILAVVGLYVVGTLMER